MTGDHNPTGADAIAEARPPDRAALLRAEVARAAKLDDVGYMVERRAVAKALGVPVGELDKLRQREKRLPRSVPPKSFEHSNEPQLCPTGSGKSERSNGRSNEVRTEADLYEAGRELIEAEDPLRLVREAIRARGYAGDTAPVEMVYVAVASRFCLRPINLHIEAPSSAGKNYVVDCALALHPPQAFYLLSASSPRALVYNDEDFQNRVVVIAEADSIPQDGPAASAIRAIANDAKMIYETVEKDPETGQFVARRIEKEGPTGLITTSTRPLDSQMATRCLTVTLPDNPAQTRDVLRVEARQVEGAAQVAAPDLDEFHAYQRWLAMAGQKIVIVPFAGALAELIPVGAVRLRRDFKQLLSAIQTFAFLTQRHRPRTPAGDVVATVEDYRRARPARAPLRPGCRGGGDPGDPRNRRGGRRWRNVRG